MQQHVSPVSFRRTALGSVQQLLQVAGNSEGCLPRPHHECGLHALHYPCDNITECLSPVTDEVWSRMQQQCSQCQMNDSEDEQQTGGTGDQEVLEGTDTRRRTCSQAAGSTLSLNPSLPAFLPVLLNFWTLICSKHVFSGVHSPHSAPPSVAKWKSSDRWEKQLWLAVQFSNNSTIKVGNIKQDSERRTRINPRVCPRGLNPYVHPCVPPEWV